MTWTKADIFTATPAVDRLTMQLQALGIQGCAVRDAKDFRDFLAQKTGRWDYVDEDLLSLSDCETMVTIYLPDNEQGERTLEQVEGLLTRLRASDAAHRFGRLEMTTCTVREEDWANNWKAYFKPFPVGKTLYIKPSWEPLTPAASDRKVLTIDPGSSFGTGQHHTTRLCLELLERAACPGMRQLDLGCGSGILLIAGLLLGAQSVTGVDIDENAVATAGENAQKNGFLGERVRLFSGDIRRDTALRARLGTGFDVLTANIVADVLIDMAPIFPGLLKPRGTLILSGIIESRAPEVLGAVQSRGFEAAEQSESGGWAAMWLRRNG